jgi:hypothetical protein
MRSGRAGNGLRTPMLVSGPAAADFAAAFGRLGASVEVLAGAALERDRSGAMLVVGFAVAGGQQFVGRVDHDRLAAPDAHLSAQPDLGTGPQARDV